MGGVSAAISKTCSAPIEAKKLRIVNIAKPYSPYTGIMNIWSAIISEEGLKSLWKGNVFRYSPTQALNFAFKDYIKRIINKNKKRDSYAL